MLVKYCKGVFLTIVGKREHRRLVIDSRSVLSSVGYAGLRVTVTDISNQWQSSPVDWVANAEVPTFKTTESGKESIYIKGGK